MKNNTVISILTVQTVSPSAVRREVSGKVYFFVLEIVI